ncbi:MAG: hypothetical protein RBT42_10535, partial [Aquabacterium sp.]|nr:hypothetical protein [Aquabacterium sp.]
DARHGAPGPCALRVRAPQVKTSGTSSWLHSPGLEPPRNPGRFNPAHDIFGMDAITKTKVIYWQVKNKKTGKIENSQERGRFDCVYRSTAAHGKTIFWRYTPEYVKATGAKEYK